MTPQVWAHRGASAKAPENSLEAFEIALVAGADGIELDVQRTADGVLVVTHDETIDRLTGHTGRIAELTLAQLRQFRFSAPWPDHSPVILPTLDEVLDLCRGKNITINLELKNSEVPYRGMERQIVSTVTSWGLQEQVIYSSFNPISLWRLHWIAPHARTGYLYSEARQRPWLAAYWLRVAALHPSTDSLELPDLVQNAHARGLSVHVWTVDDPGQWQKCLDLGVDAIITNQPEEALVYYRGLCMSP